MYANRMREYFEKALLDPDWLKLAEENETHPGMVLMLHDPGIFMSYWYGGLYVVVEGWHELGLSDPTIDNLLQSSNVALLKRYRNGFFHFQKQYFDQRFTSFMASQDSVPWVRKLNLAFGDYFLLKHEEKTKRTPTTNA
jgi:hypothetical protein